MIEAVESKYRAYLSLGIGIFSLGFSAIFVRWANASRVTTTAMPIAIPVTVSEGQAFRRHRFLITIFYSPSF